MAAPLVAAVGVAAGVLTAGTVALAGLVACLFVALGGSTASNTATADIPAAMLTLYQ